MPTVMPSLECRRFEHSMALWCDLYFAFRNEFSWQRVKHPKRVREIVSFLRWSLHESGSREVMAAAEYALGEHLFDYPEFRKHLPRFFAVADIERLADRLRVWNGEAKFERHFASFLRSKQARPLVAPSPFAPMTPALFRHLALVWPGALESAHMGHPDFRVAGGKIFASLGYPDAGSGMVKLKPAQQRAFVRTAPRVFAPCAGAWGERGATSVGLAAATIADVGPAIEAAWRNALEELKAKRG